MFSHDDMVYWEFLVAGKLEFTQFDPLVAEKHSGLQGLSWEGNSIKRVENWHSDLDGQARPEY